MNSKELREKFISFFKEKGHRVIPSASLVPENDPTVLFTTAGMHPLVPFLMGENHPEGKKVTSSQKCIRTGDIDEVGDKVHHTFFEMLGNWSFGDYFKDDAIDWSFEFLTSSKWLNIDKNKFAVSVFAGDDDAPFDRDAYDKWLSLGIASARIAKLPKKNNWWGPAGETGPCGPDTEMFYWTGKGEAPANFQDTCDDPNWVEIWNDVFMEYDRTAQGYEPLKQKNVDTGMGLERMLAVMNGFDDNYRTDLFWPMIEEIEKISGKSYESAEPEFRIIADHIKATIFAIGDGVVPSNKGAGYIVRRLIRRAVIKAHQLGIEHNFTSKIAEKVFEIYDGVYFYSSSESEKSESSRQVSNNIVAELDKEESKFRETLKEGLRQFDRLSGSSDVLSGQDLFNLYQSFGFPLELSLEVANQRAVDISNEAIQQFNDLVLEHQELSRTASAGMFKGGLADSGEETKKLHTAAHLLLASLRKVLGDGVYQKGSNITAERLRFDFSYPLKMTPEQIRSVEEMVNDQIKADLTVNMTEMRLAEAKEQGAMGVFDSKYGEKVKVYTMGSSAVDPSTGSGPREFFSREICGGPHASRTGELGHFKIVKEESSSAGVRRIKAILK